MRAQQNTWSVLKSNFFWSRVRDVLYLASEVENIIEKIERRGLKQFKW